PTIVTSGTTYSLMMLLSDVVSPRLAGDLHALHSFPTRALPICRDAEGTEGAIHGGVGRPDPGGSSRPFSRLARADRRGEERNRIDRKSTRLNSSHVKISYAVFCLKKKNSPTLGTCSSPRIR